MVAKWRLIHDPPLRGEINMQRDLQILEEVASAKAPPALRLYSWSPPALSIGRFQKAEEVADLEACRRQGVDIVRRPTGGRAILHDRELTYSLTIPDERSYIPAGVIPSYRFISRALLDAFVLLGIEAELSPESKRGAGVAPGSCFDSPSAYELQIGGKKVVGSAQMRRDGVLLQHGSILLKLQPRLYSLLLRLPPVIRPHRKQQPACHPEQQIACHPERSEGSLSRQNHPYIEDLGCSAAGLLDLGYNISKDELAVSIAAGFARLFDVEWIKEELSIK